MYTFHLGHTLIHDLQCLLLIIGVKIGGGLIVEVGILTRHYGISKTDINIINILVAMISHNKT